MERRIQKTVLTLVCIAALAPATASAKQTASTTITGAGSTLVAPLVSVWTQPVDQAFGYQVQYSPVGSGGGISAVTSRTADFGASDAPLSPDQQAACHGCVQIPWALSATTVSYNLKGVPNETGTGQKGNSGVAGAIANTDGAIGYISAAYTLTNHLPVAAVKNAAGVYATPGLRGIAAAAASVKKVPSDFHISIANPLKAERHAYPISTFTYVIVPTQTPKANELRKFVFWAVTQGQKYGPKLIFAKLPKQVLAADEKALTKIHSAT